MIRGSTPACLRAARISGACHRLLPAIGYGMTSYKTSLKMITESPGCIKATQSWFSDVSRQKRFQLTALLSGTFRIVLFSSTHFLFSYAFYILRLSFPFVKHFFAPPDSCSDSYPPSSASITACTLFSRTRIVSSGSWICSR